MTQEEEDKLLKREKSFVDRIGWSALLTLIAMSVAIISSFAVSQYRQNEQEKIISNQQIQINDLKKDKENDGRALTVVETEIKALNASIGELKDQNKETYRLLLDMSKRQ